ncbi:hypothetical protein [Streptomyces yaizuensis]|uniref:Phosphatase PAP2 family protein n=1 Tax=Streptomyces yaizuensis TaxID=2989713 RepID=A0ABQ5NZM6_9ACTN|nr:hypothetical protein [Streptomyces sp. YSPA8]GLF95660.1 phosphatase PAP2 family protein [Streptomyces sp. YSPA8]
MTGVAAGRDLRLAGRISAWCEPRNWMLAAAPLVGWRADGAPGAAWGVLAAVVTGVVPSLFITAGGRLRRWGSGLPERRDRLAAAPWIVFPVAAGAVALHHLGAPSAVTALVVAMTAVLCALAAITTAWKVSAHSAVAAGTSAVLILAYGSWMLPLAAVATATAWSRLRLGRHTAAQVVVGVTVGAAAAGTVFALLR